MNTTLTGITVATTGPHTVAFVGTASGSLKKVFNSYFVAVKDHLTTMNLLLS